MALRVRPGAGENQPPPLEGYDLFAENRPLVEALAREGGGAWEARARELGRLLGGEPLEWGRLANEHPPTLRTHDRFGNRIDEVEFHPAWHRLLELGVTHGLHALPWREPGPGAHVARAALFMTLSQVEAGVGCPLSMTAAAVPALRAEPALAAEWEPRLTSLTYDPGLRPASTKAGALCGMAMTERQGGSDVRANTTRARPDGDGWTLDGHKWFCSAPMSDAFLVLAQAPDGLSCFLVPRVTEDGERNGIRLERLKDKLGNRSNASAEIALEDASATLVGEEGRGVPTILEMVVQTRLDCVLGSAALMRRAVGGGDAPRGAPRGLRPAARRPAADGERARRPLPRVGGGDRDGDAPRPRLRRGRAVPAPRHGRREVLGVQGDPAARGRGARVPRRQRLRRGVGPAAPLPREPAQLDLGGLRQRDRARRAAGDRPRARVARGVPRRARARAAGTHAEAALADADEPGARRLVEALATALQASLLVRHAPSEVADAFVATRLRGDRGRAYGTLPRGLAVDAIVDRHRPRV